MYSFGDCVCIIVFFLRLGDCQESDEGMDIILWVREFNSWHARNMYRTPIMIPLQ